MRTKTNKRKSVALLTLFSLLLVLSLVLSITAAWFTSKDSLDDEISFGTLVINATNSEAKLVLRAENTNTLVPGDDFTVKYNVENTGTEDAYAVAYLSLEATDEDGNKIDAPIEHNLFLLESYDLTTTDYQTVTAPSVLEAGSENKKSNLVIKTNLPTTLGNELQGANVKVKLTIYAIQKRNLELADAMTEIDNLIKADYPELLTATIEVNGTTTTYESQEDFMAALDYSTEAKITLYEDITLTKNLDLGVQHLVNGNPNGVTIDLNGYSLDIGYLGECDNDLANSITIIGNGSNDDVSIQNSLTGIIGLYGGSFENCYISCYFATEEDFTLENLTFTNCNFDLSGLLTFTNCVFNGDFAYFGGFEGFNDYTKLENSTINGNIVGDSSASNPLKFSGTNIVTGYITVTDNSYMTGSSIITFEEGSTNTVGGTITATTVNYYEGCGITEDQIEAETINIL